MDRNELSFTYFPDNYSWSHGSCSPWAEPRGAAARSARSTAWACGCAPGWATIVGAPRKTFKVFTREESGYHHCQSGNVSIGVAYMWNWLEDALRSRSR